MKSITTKSKILIAMLFAFILGASSLGFVCFQNQSFSSSIVAEETVVDGTTTDTMDATDGVDISSITEVWEQSSDASYASSNEISTPAELMSKINSDPKGSYKLANDIDLSGKIWTPLSTFAGTLDGQGYKIIGLTINDTITSNDFGLFAKLKGATIKNLYLTGVNIVTSKAMFVGAIAGKRDNTVADNKVTIEDCGIIGGQITVTSTGNVRVSSFMGDGYVNNNGGNTYIYRSFSEINIKTTSTSTQAGTAGIGLGCYIYQSYFFGEFSCYSSSQYGLIGCWSQVYNCYARTISGTTTQISNWSTTNCYLLDNATSAPNNFWVKDTDGVMHGTLSKGKYVLRGVGNINVLARGYKVVINSNSSTPTYTTQDKELIVKVFPTEKKKVFDQSSFSTIYSSHCTLKDVYVYRNVLKSSYSATGDYKLVTDVTSHSYPISKNLINSNYAYIENSYSRSSTYQQSKSNFSMSILTSAGADYFSVSNSDEFTLDIAGNKQGFYQILLGIEGQIMGLDVKKVQKNSLTDGDYTNAEYAKLSLVNVYTGADRTKRETQSLDYDTTECNVYYVRKGEKIQIEIELDSSHPNAYVARYYTSNVGGSGITYNTTPSNGNTAPDTAIGHLTASETSTHTLWKIWILFDNEHTVNISDVNGDEYGEFNVIYNQAFSSINLSTYKTGYTLLGIYDSPAKEIVDYSATLSSITPTGSYFNTATTKNNLTPITTKKWTGENNSTIYILWMRNRNTISYRVMFEGSEVSDPSVYLNLDLAEIAQGSSYYYTSNDTTNRELSNFMYCQSGYNFSLNAYPTTGYKISSIVSTISAHGANSSTASDEGTLYTINDIYDAGKVTITIEAEVYSINVKTYISYGEDSKISTNAVGKISFDINGKTTELDLKTNGASVNIPFNKLAYYTITPNAGYTYQDIIFTSAQTGLNYANKSGGYIRITDAVNVTTDSIIITLIYNESTFNVDFYYGSTKINNQKNVVDNTGDIVFAGDEKTVVSQNGQYGSKVITHTTSSWEITYSTNSSNYETVGLEVYNKSGTKVGAYDVATKKWTTALPPIYGTPNIFHIGNDWNVTWENYALANNDVVNIRIIMDVITRDVKFTLEKINDATKTKDTQELNHFSNVANNSLLQFHTTGKQYSLEKSIETAYYVERASYNFAESSFYNEPEILINGTLWQGSPNPHPIKEDVEVIFRYTMKTVPVNVYTAIKTSDTQASIINGATATQISYNNTSNTYAYVYLNDKFTVSYTNIVGYNFVKYIIKYGSSAETTGTLTFASKDEASTNASFNETMSASMNAEGVSYYAIIEPIEYTFVFNYDGDFAPILADGTTKAQLSISGSVNKTLKYSATELGDFPIVQVTNGEYTFGGWALKQNGENVFVKYTNGSWGSDKTFSTSTYDKSIFANTTINLYAIYSASTIDILYNPNGGVWSGTDTSNKSGTVIYGTSNYNGLTTLPSKSGFVLAGWKIGETNYITYNQDGTITYKNWDRGTNQSNILTAIWEARGINVTYSSGSGKFADGSTQKTGTVTFGNNDYTNVPKKADLVRDNYEFLYFLYKNTSTGTSYYVYPSDGAGTSSIFNDSTKLNGATFTAVWAFVGFEVDYDKTLTWVYDGTSHNISVVPQTLAGVTYTYTWKVDYLHDNNSNTYTVNSTTSAVALKKVVESGAYTITITATNSGADVDSNSKTVKKDIVINVNITKKQLSFSQTFEGTKQADNHIVKYFDNSNAMPTSAQVVGIESGDLVSLTATYSQTSVGQNLTLSSTLTGTDSENYAKPTSVSGEIKALPLEFYVSGSRVQIGSQTNKISVPYTLKTSVSDVDLGTLSKNNINISAKIQTSQNKIGVYTSSNSTYKLEFAQSVAVSGTDASNFAFAITGQYEILEATNSIRFSVNVVCDDKDNINIAELGQITVDSAYYEQAEYDNSNISFVGSKDFYGSKSNIVIKLTIKDTDYWVKTWESYVDGEKELKDLGTSNTGITYSISSTAANEIVINVYLTTLNPVNFDYQLLTGEQQPSSWPTSTYFAYQRKISESIAEYPNKSSLPEVERAGWTFDGWKDSNGNAVTTSKTWTYNSNTPITLYASWVMSAPALNAKLSNVSKVYDALDSKVAYEITNKNDYLTYTYTWEYKANSSASYTTLSSATGLEYIVKNVSDSGIYRLTLKATGGKYSQTVTGSEITVNITPYILYEKLTVTLNKEYDDTDALIPQELRGAGSEMLVMSGRYTGKVVGSKIDKTSLMLSSDNADTNNYSINKTNISDASQIIAKPVVIDIGNITTQYNGKVFAVTGTYTDDTTSKTYSYKFETVSANAGKYAGVYSDTNTQNTIKVVSFGTDAQKPNFDITINGSITIAPIVVEDIVWSGSTEVIFDGKQHTLSINSAYLNDLNAEIVYLQNGKELSSAPRNVGVYTVVAQVSPTQNITVEGEISTTLRITKKTIYISVGSFEKIYDGKTTIVPSTLEIYADSQKTTKIDTAITNYKQITLCFDFDNANAGENKSVKVSFDTENVENDNYSISSVSFKGNINKKQIALSIKAQTKQYDALAFTVQSQDITVFASGSYDSGLIDGEILAGSITFTNVVNAKADAYDINISTYAVYENNLTVSGVEITTNYEILTTFASQDGTENKLTIEKARINVISENNKTYVYSGNAVSLVYTYERVDGKTVPLPEEIVFEHYNSSSQKLASAPYSVGTYTAMPVVSGSDSANYEITNQTGFKYAITERLIEFYVDVSATYNGEKVTVLLDSTKIDANSLGFGDGDISECTLTTVLPDTGTYNASDSSRTIFVRKIMKGTEDVTSNYSFGITGTITIVQQEVLFSAIQFVSSYEYDATKKQLKAFIEVDDRTVEVIFGDSKTVDNGYIYNVSRKTTINGTETNTSIVNAEDILYAGVYSYQVSFKNYKIINDGLLKTTINQKNITNIQISDTDKQYDGTNAFLGTITSTDLCEIDVNNGVTIVGAYSDANVGTNQIAFAINSDNLYLKNSYKFNLTSTYAGKITPKQIELNLQPYKTYYTNKDIILDITSFTITAVNGSTPALNLGEYFIGNVVIKLYDVGQYELSSYIDYIDTSTLTLVSSTGTEITTQNYEIKDIKGIIEIAKTQISAQITDLSYVYDATAKYVTVVANVYGINGEIAKDDTNLVSIVYLDQNNNTVDKPINAGTYNLKVTFNANYADRYEFVNDDGEVLPAGVYTYTSNVRLSIAQRQISVVVADSPIVFGYSGNVAEYTLKKTDIIDPTEGVGGLLNIHSISGSLKTSESMARSYSVYQAQNLNNEDIVTDGIKILAGTTDVTSNYAIRYYTAQIIIGSMVADIDENGLSNKVYNTKDHASEIYVEAIFDGQTIKAPYDQTNKAGTSLYLADLKVLEGETYIFATNAINAGKYSVTLKVNADENVLNFEEKVLYFEVSRKQITTVEGIFTKQYDKTATVLEVTSPDIYDADKNDVVISGTYMKDDVNPAIDAGTYKIKFSLSGSKKDNYVIAIADKTGSIDKRNVTLALSQSITTYYTGSSVMLGINEFVAYDDNNAVVTPFVEKLIGNVIIDVVDSATYDLTEISNLIRLDVNENLQGGEVSLFANYKVVSYEGQLIISPCQVLVDTIQNSFVYNGQPQEIQYSISVYNNNGAIDTSIEGKIISVLYNNNAQAQQNVGQYAVTYQIAQDYASNFVIVDENGNILQAISDTLTITKRQIQVVMHEVYEKVYDTKQAVYTLTIDDIIDPTQEKVGGLVDGQSVVGTFTANGVLPNTYEISGLVPQADYSAYAITPVLAIVHNSVDVTSNYEIVSFTGTIIIGDAVAETVNQEHLDSLVYNGNDYVASKDIYITIIINDVLEMFVLDEDNVRGKLTNLKYNGGTTSVAKRAGNYTVELTIDGTDKYQNYEIAFTIAQKQITTIDYQTEKQYDGTPNIVGEISSPDIISGDDVVFSAYYQDATGNKASSYGEYSINVSISGVDAENYVLALSEQLGKINPKEIILKLSADMQTYYTGEAIVLDIELFEAIDTNNQSYSEFIDGVGGSIKIDIVNVGNYDLSEISNLIEADLSEVAPNILDNYSIIYYIGNITIDKAEIEVSVSDTNKIYDATSQPATISATLYDNRGKITTENLEKVVAITYKDDNDEVVISPINSGNYSITLSVANELQNCYTLVNENFDVVESYVSSKQLYIAQRQISIVMAEAVTYPYDGQVKTYTLTNDDVIDGSSNGTGGLVSGHSIDGVLKTNSAAGGKNYIISSLPPQTDFSAEDITPIINAILTSDGTNVLSNYQIIEISGEIRIKNTLSSEINTSKLDDLVYDKTDKVATQNLQVSFTLNSKLVTLIYGQQQSTDKTKLYDLMYNDNGTFVSVTSAVNSGEYKFKLDIDEIDEYQGYEITFNIDKKQINSVLFDGETTANKIYDTTATVLNTITSNDIISGDNVVFSGIYVNNSMEATDSGSYDISITYSGTDAFNYQLVLSEATGTITARPITLSIKDGVKVVYDGTNQTISAENIVVSGSYGLCSNENLVGYITLNQIEFGEYTLNLDNAVISALFVQKANTNDSTKNYEITLSGKYNISALEVSVSFTEIDLTYNGETQGINPFLIIDQVSEVISEQCLSAVKISYNKETINAGNYTATVSSSSANFVFVGETTKQFEIKKKDFYIDLGEIVALYNPTSSHDGVLENSHANGVIEGQALSGNYKLKNVGNSVGTYTVSAGDILIENVDIKLNGESLLSNYNYIVDNNVGSIEIVAFDLRSDQVFLKENSFVYSRTNIVETLIVNFYDANNKLQTISISDTSLGSFVLSEKVEAVNVGQYHIVVTIPNYDLENNILSFEITQKEIVNVDYISSKRYNGDEFVYNSNGIKELSSQDVISGDNVVIIGRYVLGGNATSNVGENLEIVFEIQDENEIPQSNYYLNISARSGTITEQKITIKVSNQSLVYVSTGIYEIPYSQDTFTLTSGYIIDGQTLDGKLIVEKPDFDGNFNLANADKSQLRIVSGETDVTDNYVITITGTLTIEKAEIYFDFSEYASNYVYSNSPVEINPTITVSNGEQTLPEISVIYAGTEYNETSAPKNVGDYTVTFTVNNSHFNIATDNTFDFEITPKQIIIAVGEIEKGRYSKIHGEDDPAEFHYQIESEFGETITISLTRESGEQVGEYDMYINYWDNQNYTIIAEENALVDLFRIKKAGNINVIILDTENNKNLLTKVYDAQTAPILDLADLDYETSPLAQDGTSEIVTGTITFEQSVNVGEYSVASYSFETHNYENFTLVCELKYTITAKPITLEVASGWTKEFDGNTNFDKEINIFDANGNILDEKVFPLTVTAKYISLNVGENIELALTFADDLETNYSLVGSYTASITKRAVEIKANEGQGSVYGDQLSTIAYSVVDKGVSTFSGNIEDYLEVQLSISLKDGQTKYIAGQYEISSKVSSDNLDIAFVSGTIYTISKRQVTISSSEGSFSKVYDGTSIVTNSVIISNMVEGDDLTATGEYYNDDQTSVSSSVQNDKIIVWTLNGVDKDNYFTENSLGNILEKMVTVVYDYITDEDMINIDLVANNSVESSSLIYGSTVASSIGNLPKASHEGYDFVGWFLDESLTIPFTEDTVIDELIWSVDETEKTVYAKWSIKQFNFTIISATRVNNVYTTEGAQGGSIDDINGKYNYYSVIQLQNICTAFGGYEFIGFADEVNGAVNEDYLANGIKVEAEDIVIYAKFKPLSATITLSSNGGIFTRCEGWTFNNSNTVATMDVEYNKTFADFATFPEVNRSGYVFDKWLDELGAEFDTSADRVIDFYENINLTASYTATEIYFNVSANGGYFEDVDTSIWEIDETNDDGKATKVRKLVKFDEKIGEIITPVRQGWSFGGWDDISLNAETIWTFLEEKTLNAVWEENTYTITISAEYGSINAKVYNQNHEEVGFIGETPTVVNGENNTIIVTLSTTHTAQISVIDNQGWTFEKWTSNFASVNDSTEREISISNFVENITLSASFTANDNNITIVIEDASRGYAYSGTNSTQENGTITFTAKTATSVEIAVVAYEGYELEYWKVDAGEYNFTLEGDDTALVRTLKDFVSDITVTISFTQSLNSITITADSDKGSFAITDETTNSNNYVIKLKTDSELVFDVYQKHGYLVDIDLKNWIFVTASQQKGEFELVEMDGYIRVTFKGFTASGSINIPFVKDSFSVTIVSVLKNDDMQTIDNTLTEIVELDDAGVVTLLDSGATITKEYLSQVVFTPKQNIDGYTFYAWSSLADKTRQILVTEGNVSTTAEGQMTFQINDDITIYVVYSINTYRLTFKTSDETKGQVKIGEIVANEINTNVKFGASSPVVYAVVNRGYEFVRWVEEKTGDVVSTSTALQLSDIKQDNTYIAEFIGTEISITVNVVLSNDDVFTEEEIDFATLTIAETLSTKVTQTSRTNTTLTFNISTITGENVSLDFLASYGYEFAGLTTDPRYMFTEENGHIVFEKVGFSAVVTINVKAIVYDVVLKLVGKVHGGNIFYDATNKKGVVSYEATDKELKLKVKYGGNVNSIVYSLTGYTIVENQYFEKHPTSITQGSEIYEYATGGIEKIEENKTIEIEIQSLKYQVTFKYNYEGSLEDFVSIIEFGETEFTPAPNSDITIPERYQYNFLGWNSIKVGGGRNYMFDEQGRIYSYETGENGEKTVVYGFFGGYSDVAQTLDPAYAYSSTLYAQWEEETYSVDVIFVPAQSVNPASINYALMFPSPDGRRVVYSDDLQATIIGMSYIPGYTVVIDAPTAMNGFTYYGWADEGNIIDKALINKGQFTGIMGEENLVVYLYYTFKVNVTKLGEGEVSISEHDAIYNQTLTLNAVADAGYVFKHWKLGSTELPDSTSQMDIIATAPCTYVAFFEGMQVNLILTPTEYANVKVAATTSLEANIYRVGDLITLEAYDVRYGYAHTGWEGEYSSTISNNTYQIIAEDYTRGYIKFIPKTTAQKINVQFIINDYIGGEFVFDGSTTVNQTRTYDYDSVLMFELQKANRYVLTSLTLNGVEISTDITSLLVHQSNGFTTDGKNVIRATYNQLLWVDVRMPFTGLGTEADPYIITNANQLAEMYYLINNNIEAQGTVPYADAYYKVKGNINLSERFWQPIGTQENPFNGTFEIRDFKITELYLDKEYAVTNFGGVFGYLGPNAKIIEGNGDYVAAIIIICSVVGLLLILLTIFIIHMTLKKKKLKKLSGAMNNQKAELLDEADDEQQQSSQQKDEKSDNNEDKKSQTDKQ